MQPIAVFVTNAITEPNINMPPMHIETKNTVLEAMMTLEKRLHSGKN